MNRSLSAIIISCICIAGIAGITIYLCMHHQKTAYINTTTVFNEFKMKKVLEAEFKKVENMRKLQLDSMTLGLNILSRQAVTPGQKQLLSMYNEEYIAKRDEYIEANNALSDKYNEQIWTQLNQYIKDYGNTHGYDYIYGATGDGNLMYASEKNEISKEVIQFVNEKYAGITE